jgi:molecular chaperone HtpG
VIKEGIYSDYTNKETLLEIVRYKSSAVDGMVSLDEYISRGDSEKKEIYYIIGKDEKTLRNSPLLEAYKKANIEVLIMDDEEVDSIVTPMIGAYKEWSFKDITTIEAPESKSKEEKEEIEKEYKELTSKIKDVLGDEVKEVKISTRLTESPSCVIKDSSDPMASMAAMFAQMGQEAPEIPLILEINPDSEMIKKLDKLDDEKLFEDVSWVLLDSAKLAEGLEPKDSASFAKRVAKLASKAL